MGVQRAESRPPHRQVNRLLLLVVLLEQLAERVALASAALTPGTLQVLVLAHALGNRLRRRAAPVARPEQPDIRAQGDEGRKSEAESHDRSSHFPLSRA